MGPYYYERNDRQFYSQTQAQTCAHEELVEDTLYNLPKVEINKSKCLKSSYIQSPCDICFLFIQHSLQVKNFRLA